MSLFTSQRRLMRLGATAIVIGLLSLQSRAEGPPDVKALTEAAEKNAAAVKPMDPRPGVTVDRERVKALAEHGVARGRIGLQELIREHEAREAREHPDRPGAPASASSRKAVAKVSGRLVVALSSSMPEEMLREYMRQLDGIPEGVVILRGFKGGARTVKPTGLWIEALRRKERECRECGHRLVQVMVDPIAFAMLNIRQVPAVTYLPEVEDLRHCDAEVLEAAEVVYGAVSIRSALERLRRDGVRVPDELISRFQKRV